MASISSATAILLSRSLAAAAGVPSVYGRPATRLAVVHDPEEVQMAEPSSKALDGADETRTFEHGTVQIARVGSITIGRVRFEPGFRWSNDLKPIVGGDACMIHHKGYAISGRLRVRMEDGTELEIEGGDAHEIPPGHDGWVVGDEPYVAIDFSEDISGFAEPSAEG
jgi:hypothetical protein